MNFDLAKKVVTNVLGRGGLIVSKYGPDFMVGFGITGLVGATVIVLSEKNKTKAEDIIELHRLKMDVIEEARGEHPNEYSEEDKVKDTAVVLTKTTIELVKVYGPAIALGLFSVGCILKSHDIITQRNVGLLAAYNAIDTGFKQYRGRVIERFGKDTDFELRHGVEIKEVAVIDEKTGEVTDGKMLVVKKEDPFQESIYAKWFSGGEDGHEKSFQWRKDAFSNEFFLKAQQRYANDKLRAQGHLFLNEVYDSLGLKRTPEGAIVGWVAGSGGDDKVDFDLYNPINEGAFDLVEGHNRSIFLDFNVDGAIWDKI